MKYIKEDNLWKKINSYIRMDKPVNPVVKVQVPEYTSASIVSPNGRPFISVDFASYGMPTYDNDGNVSINPRCHSASSKAVVESYLIGRTSAVIPASNTIFSDPCYGTVKSLTIIATVQTVANEVIPGWHRTNYIFAKYEDIWKSTFPSIGSFYEGGYYAGIMDTTDIAGGNGLRYMLILSPKEYQIRATWATQYNSVNTGSFWNGLENTTTVANVNYPAANYCANLNIDGFDDWYLPARDELELVYRNFKPTTDNNFINNDPYAGDFFTVYGGYNSSSDPPGSSYTLTEPTQTNVEIFKVNNSQSMWPPRFEGGGNVTYWTSTSFNAQYAWRQSFKTSNAWYYLSGDSGRQDTLNRIPGGKLDSRYVRAVRRILI